MKQIQSFNFLDNFSLTQHQKSRLIMITNRPVSAVLNLYGVL